MQFRVLGPLEIHGGDDELVRVGSAKQRAVLAVLLVNANRPVSSDRLVDLVWPDRPPPSAVGAIRTYISSLRRTLRLNGLVTEPAGYRLRVGPADLDLLAFEELAADGEQALLAGDPATAAERLRRGLALWRGRPLEDIAIDPDREGRLAGLEERRLAATETLIQARLDLGQHGELVAELRQLVHERPLRERLWELWMLALYRTGRQREALAAYQALRTQLVGELGIEPSRRVRDLHQLILHGDPRLDASPSVVPRPRQLPPDIAGFAGREAAIDRLQALVRSGGRVGPPPIAAIDGVGGIGKSALAVHVGHLVAMRFPDGQLYADLLGAARDSAPVPPLDVLGQFLRALGVPGAHRLDLAEAGARFRSETARRRLLVVLDNAADAAQVRPLLPAGPGCAVLLTSRRVLATLDGATHIHLDVLAEDEAVALLARSAGAERIATDAAAARQVSELCGGLPLALRIAGARLAARPGWPVRALADRLGDARRRLDELQVADLDVRAVLQVSHDALAADPAAARAFALLGCVDGPDISLPMAARLLDTEPAAAERTMDRLVDARLLESRTLGRYRFHDLVRLLARELAPVADAVVALSRAMRWQVATSWQAFGALRPGDQRLADAGAWADGGMRFDSAEAALDWLEAERANLVATVSQATDVDAAIPGQLARALFAFFHIRGHWPDWERVNRTALTVARATGDRVSEAFAHRDLGALNELRGSYDAALEHLTTSLELFRSLDDRHGQAACLNGLGTVHDSLGQWQSAVRCIEEALAIARDLCDLHGQAVYRNNLGPLYGRLGRYDDAVRSLTEARAEFVILGNLRGQAASLTNLGEVYEAQGLLIAASTSHCAGLRMFDELADKPGQAHCLTHLGDVYQRLEQPDQAVEMWRRALPILEELGMPAAAEIRSKLSDHGRPNE